MNEGKLFISDNKELLNKLQQFKTETEELQ